MILEAGNIREDMFHLLLVTDLVIAYISIHNANVFYELGIRHAVRGRRTYMIRAKGVAEATPARKPRVFLQDWYSRRVKWLDRLLQAPPSPW